MKRMDEIEKETKKRGSRCERIERNLQTESRLESGRGKIVWKSWSSTLVTIPQLPSYSDCLYPRESSTVNAARIVKSCPRSVIKYSNKCSNFKAKNNIGLARKKARTHNGVCLSKGTSESDATLC